MTNKKIWGSLLFAKTDWNNPDDISYYLEKSSDIVFYIDDNNKEISLYKWTIDYFFGIHLLHCHDEYSKMENLSDHELLNKYAQKYFKKFSEDFNEILVQEAFEVIDENREEDLVEIDVEKWLELGFEVDEDEDTELSIYYYNKYLLILEKLNEKISKIHYKVTNKIISPNASKYRIQPSINGIENYLYHDFMEYLKENEIPIRCSYCTKVIENPSKIQLTKARKKEPIFHQNCFNENRKEKDRLRKEELRRK